MEEARKRRLTLTGFILVVFLFFAGFVYSVFVSDRKDIYWTYFQQRAAQFKTAETARRRADVHDPIILHTDEVVSVGKIKLIYRGRADRMLTIGVIINDLDPEMEYRHRISLRQAEEGVRLGDVPFMVLSSSASKLKLQRKRQP
jgi:hypothetical protein